MQSFLSSLYDFMQTLHNRKTWFFKYWAYQFFWLGTFIFCLLLTFFHPFYHIFKRLFHQRSAFRLALALVRYAASQHMTQNVPFLMRCYGPHVSIVKILQV